MKAPQCPARTRSPRRVWALLWFTWAITLRGLAAGDGSQVAVVYNTRVADSEGVARHYATQRQVPSAQVFGFDLPDNEVISRGDYHERLELPLLQALRNARLLNFGSRDLPDTNGVLQRIPDVVVSARIRYVVLCYGVPLKISPDPAAKEPGAETMQAEFRRDDAAVDSELACLPLVPHGYHRLGFLNNTLYGSTNAAGLNPTNGLLLVTRLDGPTAAIARGLVDKALTAERDGLNGRAYFDLRGLTNGSYKIGDDWIRQAAVTARLLGYETEVDEDPGSFRPAAPLSQIALYAGWYDENVSGPFALPSIEFMPGAFAYHLHSFSAATLRSTTRQWVGPLLAGGATATMGCVNEPYLQLTPNIGLFFARFLLEGFTLGEAAYAAQPGLSWQTTVIGDPLYRPGGRILQAVLDDLAMRHSPRLEWPVLQLANRQARLGTPLEVVVHGLEDLPITATSPVLTEKLAALYQEQKRTNNAIATLGRVLDQAPSPGQRLRVRWELGRRQTDAGRTAEAYTNLQALVRENPDYPGLGMVYQRLVELAGQLHQPEAAERWAEAKRRLETPAVPAAGK